MSRLSEAGFRVVDRIWKDDRYYRSENGTEFRLRLSGSGEKPGFSEAHAGSGRPPMFDEEQTATTGDEVSWEASGEGAGVVTHKEKRIRDGVEYNVEREFTVDSARAFESLCAHIGAERFAVKQKSGWYLSRDGLTAEVIEVVSLGWFLEIEAVIEETSGDDGRDRAAASVREALSHAGINPSAIEPRTYLSMLGFRDSPPQEPSG